MTQFAVFANPGRRTGILFVVQVQSSRYDQTYGRIVVPLTGLSVLRDHWLAPTFDILGQRVTADLLNVVTLPAARLGAALLILSEPDQDRLMSALDGVISRA